MVSIIVLNDMKIKLILPLAAIIFLVSCRKEPRPEELVPGAMDFLGTVSVVSKGETFHNDNKTVCFSPSEDGTGATLIIYHIKFVPAMPVTIDVTIPDVQIRREGERVLLEADNVVPLALGGKYPKYLVTNLTGVQEGDRLDFSLNFGENPTSFSGAKIIAR